MGMLSVMSTGLCWSLSATGSAVPGLPGDHRRAQPPELLRGSGVRRARWHEAALQPLDDDDAVGAGGGGGGVIDREWSRAGRTNCAPWMTGTTRRPGTATWTCWRRRRGRTWTHRMRMAWRRRYGLRTTATWRLCGSSWRGGGYMQHFRDGHKLHSHVNLCIYTFSSFFQIFRVIQGK